MPPPGSASRVSKRTIPSNDHCRSAVDYSRIDTPQVRSIALGTIIIITLYILLQSLHVGPHELEQTTRHSLQAISQISDSWRGRSSSIVKVTSLYGQENELYAAALRSHEEHNRRHGYDLEVLRERIVNTYWSQPTYLLSLIAAELARPEEQRKEWLMCFEPDLIVLNPLIPLETFLPPPDFDEGVHFLGTHDLVGFAVGAFFLRVHEWSIRLLTDVLNVPNVHPEIEREEDKTRRAFEIVLRSDKFRPQVVYQPRLWYNAYQINTTHFEGVRGDLLVHFHDMGGDKWTAMADTIARTPEWKARWSVPFEETTYEREIGDFWERIRKARKLLGAAQAKIGEKAVFDGVRRLQYASTYEVDDEAKMTYGITALESALGVVV